MQSLLAIINEMWEMKRKVINESQYMTFRLVSVLFIIPMKEERKNNLQEVKA